MFELSDENTTDCIDLPKKLREIQDVVARFLESIEKNSLPSIYSIKLDFDSKSNPISVDAFFENMHSRKILIITPTQSQS